VAKTSISAMKQVGETSFVSNLSSLKENRIVPLFWAARFNHRLSSKECLKTSFVDRYQFSRIEHNSAKQKSPGENKMRRRNKIKEKPTRSSAKEISIWLRLTLCGFAQLPRSGNCAKPLLALVFVFSP
jgi:hypothetical protein